MSVTERKEKSHEADNMNSIGGWEILLIFIIATLVIGPGNVKKILHKTIDVIKKVRSFGDELDKESGFQEIRDELKDDVEVIRKETEKIKKQTGGLVSQVGLGIQKRRK